LTEFQEYLHCNFGIDSNTSASIIITLLVFIAGILTSEFLKLLSRLRERRAQRLAIASSIKHAITQSKKQIKSYEEIANEFTWTGNKHITLGRTILSKTDFNYKMLFDSYFVGIENLNLLRKKKSKALNRLWEALNSLEYWHERTFLDLDKFLEKYSEYNVVRNESLEEHRKLIESVLTSVTGTNLPLQIGRYIQEIDNIHVAWQQTDNRTRPDIMQNVLVKPLLLHNREHPEIQLARRSSDLLLAVSFQFDNLESLLTAYNKQFINYARIFRYNYRTLEIALKILK
jgi:hypothetical protein